MPSNKRKRDEEEEETVDGVEVPSNKRKRDEEEQQVELELDLDDNDDDFEQVEEMTLPLVISRIDNGKTVHEIEVPVMKDDEFIDDSMYRDDYEPTDSKKDFAEALDFRPPHIQVKAPDVCPICFKYWTVDQEHQARYPLTLYFFNCIFLSGLEPGSKFNSNLTYLLYRVLMSTYLQPNPQT